MLVESGDCLILDTTAAGSGRRRMAKSEPTVRVVLSDRRTIGGGGKKNV